MLTNASIEDDVRSALQADPRLKDPAEVAIDVKEGDVILRGTVGSIPQRRAAARDARAVEGVYKVYDELEVRPLDENRRQDADIRAAALQILMWDSEVPDSIDVKVESGWITITGTVSFQYQSDAAYDDVASLLGAYGITNKIKVVTF